MIDMNVLDTTLAIIFLIPASLGILAPLWYPALQAFRSRRKR
jgi:hypothetical protein